MIVTETKTINGKIFNLTYSNENKYIIREGIKYVEAYDLVELGRVYTESNEYIENKNNFREATEADYQNALAEMGGKSEWINRL